MTKKVDLDHITFKKYFQQAELLIERGYPVPTNDPFELAEQLFEANENQSQPEEEDDWLLRFPLIQCTCDE